MLAVQAGEQETRQAAAAADRLAALQQALQRRQRVAAASSSWKSTLSRSPSRTSAEAPWRSNQSKAGSWSSAAKSQQQFRQPVGGASTQRQQRFGFRQPVRRQRFAQQVARAAQQLAVGQAFGHRRRQRVFGIEHRHLRPAAVRDRDVDRAPALGVRLLRIHAQRQQLLQQLRARAAQAGEHQRVALLRVHRARIRLRRRQSRDDGGMAVPRRFQQRRHAVGVLRVAVGAGVEQHADDVDVAAGAGLQQRRAMLGAARIHARLVPQQQLHATRVVVAGDGGEQRRLALAGSGRAPCSIRKRARRQLPDPQAIASGLCPRR